jgi:Raf kinase inhibitor-like YbhB/YbcL family protein
MPNRINVRSDAFGNAGPIPWEYGAEGRNLSPQLSWDTVPGVKSWVLIADDPDAPSGTYTHWVLFDLPGDITSLPPGASNTKDQLHGSVEGTNSAGTRGYTGPNPPDGEHRYFFRLYGLDSPLELGPEATKQVVLNEIAKYNKIAEGEIMGTYVKGTEEVKRTATP